MNRQGITENTKSTVLLLNQGQHFGQAAYRSGVC